MNKKIVALVVSLVAVGGVATYVLTNNNDEKVEQKPKVEVSIATRINSECTKQIMVQYRPNGQHDISGFESFGFGPHDIQREKEVALEDVQRAIVEKNPTNLQVTEGRCLVQIDYKE